MKRIVWLIITLLLALMICGFAGKNDITGKWAYQHEPEAVVLELDKKGSAVYKDKRYEYQLTDPFITLKDENGEETNLRYRRDGKKLFLYEPTVYKYEGGGNPELLRGLWRADNKSTFEFTAKGTFREDGIFTGAFRENAEKTQFTLVYADGFEDTTCYYAIEDGKLLVEYPWGMVKVK